MVGRTKGATVGGFQALDMMRGRDMGSVGPPEAPQASPADGRHPHTGAAGPSLCPALCPE